MRETQVEIPKLMKVEIVIHILEMTLPLSRTLRRFDLHMYEGYNESLFMRGLVR